VLLGEVEQLFVVLIDVAVLVAARAVQEHHQRQLCLTVPVGRHIEPVGLVRVRLGEAVASMLVSLCAPLRAARICEPTRQLARRGHHGLRVEQGAEGNRSTTASGHTALAAAAAGTTGARAPAPAGARAAAPAAASRAARHAARPGSRLSARPAPPAVACSAGDARHPARRAAAGSAATAGAASAHPGRSARRSRAARSGGAAARAPGSARARTARRAAARRGAVAASGARAAAARAAAAGDDEAQHRRHHRLLRELSRLEHALRCSAPAPRHWSKNPRARRRRTTRRTVV
jgi:hypothetical protein